MTDDELKDLNEWLQKPSTSLESIILRGQVDGLMRLNQELKAQIAAHEAGLAEYEEESSKRLEAAKEFAKRFTELEQKNAELTETMKLDAEERTRQVYEVVSDRVRLDERLQVADWVRRCASGSSEPYKAMLLWLAESIEQGPGVDVIPKTGGPIADAIDLPNGDVLVHLKKPEGN